MGLRQRLRHGAVVDRRHPPGDLRAPRREELRRRRLRPLRPRLRDAGPGATVEGLSETGGLHPVQQAFIDEGAVQCGYCTPGFVMSLYALWMQAPLPTEAQVETAIQGNLCRCTGYARIIDAVRRTAAGD